MNERIKLLADHAKAYANQCTKDIDGDVSWHWMVIAIGFASYLMVLSGMTKTIPA